jgi:hypothetical protein
MKWEKTYNEARRAIRGVIRETVKDENYKHIMTPNRKKIKFETVYDIKTRTNIIFSIPLSQKNGNRNMDFGSLETILEITCFFNDSLNYKDGIDTNYDVVMRYGVGNHLIDSGLCNRLYHKMESNPKTYLDMLQRGDYQNFVKYFLGHIETSIHEIKTQNIKS